MDTLIPPVVLFSYPSSYAASVSLVSLYCSFSLSVSLSVFSVSGVLSPVVLAVLPFMVLSYIFLRSAFFVASSALSVLSIPILLLPLGRVASTSIRLPRVILTSVPTSPCVLAPIYLAPSPFASYLAPCLVERIYVGVLAAPPVPPLPPVLWAF